MLGADQQGIAGKGRRAVVRRMLVGGGRRVQGQDLPDPLTGGMQVICEPVSIWTEIADPETGGQAGMEQNTAGTWEHDSVSIRIRAGSGWGRYRLKRTG